MEYLQNLLDGSTVPVVTAFLLGLLTAISPCPLAANITAIGYIGRDITDRSRIFRDGLLYALGRIAAYTLLGACCARVRVCSPCKKRSADTAKCCLPRL